VDCAKWWDDGWATLYLRLYEIAPACPFAERALARHMRAHDRYMLALREEMNRQATPRPIAMGC
jgi:hypothetical protein